VHSVPAFLTTVAMRHITLSRCLGYFNAATITSPPTIARVSYLFFYISRKIKRCILAMYVRIRRAISQRGSSIFINLFIFFIFLFTGVSCCLYACVLLQVSFRSPKRNLFMFQSEEGKINRIPRIFVGDMFQV